MRVLSSNSNTVVLTANKVALALRVCVAVALLSSKIKNKLLKDKNLRTKCLRNTANEKVQTNVKEQKKEDKTTKQTTCQTIAFLEPARLVLSAAMPGHPGGSTFARHLWSATIHDLGLDCMMHIAYFVRLHFAIILGSITIQSSWYCFVQWE